MAKFRIKYPQGARAIETVEAATPDAFAMERWGMSTAKEVFDAYGVRIELLGGVEGEPADLKRELAPEEQKTNEILAAKAAIAG